MTCEVGEEGKNSISSQHDKKAKFAFKMSPGYHGVNLKACRALVLSYFVKPKFCRCRLTSIGTISRLSDYTYRLGVTVSVASYQMCAQSYTEFSLWDPEAHSLSAEILCNANVKVNKKCQGDVKVNTKCQRVVKVNTIHLGFIFISAFRKDKIEIRVRYL